MRPTNVGEDIVYALMKVRGGVNPGTGVASCFYFPKYITKECDNMSDYIGIYCIENNINHKKYIGQSIHINRRWSEHKYHLNNNTHDNDYLQKSWNKYGQDSFEFKILECCDVSELDMKERDYIMLYNTFDKDCGYNLILDCEVNRLISEETREKLRQAGKQRKNIPNMRGENNPMYGKHLSCETKEKIRAARIGQLTSEETKEKLRELRTGENNPRCVPIYCPELDEEFWGAKDAFLKYGVNRNKISECINGKRKHAGIHPTTGEKLSWIKLENKNC